MSELFSGAVLYKPTQIETNGLLGMEESFSYLEADWIETLYQINAMLKINRECYISGSQAIHLITILKVFERVYCGYNK